MPDSTVIVETQNASRYLQQLCKHFGHKTDVTYDATAGHVVLPFGECRMIASPSALTLIFVSDFAELPRIERVIGDHLARFAFRETPKIVWQCAA